MTNPGAYHGLQPMLPLFDSPEAFDRERLARRLRALAADRIYLGTSSWKYEGWLGQIYTRSRYAQRGRFSRKRFNETCLAEYAEVFPVVCGDFSFYNFPTPEFWQKLFASSPRHLRWCLKAPEDITVKHFPRHARYGPRAGQPNSGFLSAELFTSLFLDLLRPYLQWIDLIVLEFGAFGPRSYRGYEDFSRDLAAFLSLLPSDFRYAVEIRNPEFFTPEHFQLLASLNVAHVFNAWTATPGLAEQLALPGADAQEFLVSRALLRQGRAYADAVAAFSPYDRVQDINSETREAIRGLIDGARRRRIPAYLFINNRLEGNAPITIEAVSED